MIRNLLVASALGLATFAMVPEAATAAPMTLNVQTLAGEPLVEHVQWRHCRRWARECRFRWGRGWHFRRCMRRRGC